MWNKSNLLLWVSIKKPSKKGFSLPVPLPLYVVEELFESLIELITIALLFVPKKTRFDVTYSASHQHKCSFTQINGLLAFLSQLLSSLSDCEPFDLVDVKTPEVEVVIKIR